MGIEKQKVKDGERQVQTRLICPDLVRQDASPV